MALSDKAKKGIKAGVFAAGLCMLTAGVSGTCYYESEAKDALTQEARYVQTLEEHSELMQVFPQISEVYENLKADPDVSQSLDAYKDSMEKRHEWYLYGVMPPLLLGVGFMFYQMFTRRRPINPEEKK